MSKILELLLVTGTLFFLLYFLSYMLYFDKMCPNFKEDIGGEYSEIITQMGKCKSSLVCEINNVETDKKNKIINWSCDKKINNYVEFDFYMNYIVDTYNKIKNKYN